MAITTLDGVRTGLQPPFYLMKSGANGEASPFAVTNFYAGGSPAAATAPSPGLSGAALTSYAGQIPHSNPASGNAYLVGLIGGDLRAANGTVVLADRLWHNSGISATTTTAQTVNSVAWPARDRNGSTNGDGVFIAIEVTATQSNSAVTNTTLDYTNSAGTAGRTGTITSVPASIAQNALVFFHLQDGDVGVRSVQSITLGTTYIGGGSMHLIAVRPICDLPLVPANQVSAACQYDAIACGMPRIYDDSVLMAFQYGQTNYNAELAFTMRVAHG